MQVERAPGPEAGDGVRATPAGGDDWASETADRLDHLISVIRSQTTDRLVKVARLVVFGLLGAILGVAVLVLTVITLVRVLDNYIPQEVWLTYLILGAILIAGGLWAWAKKESRPSGG